MKLNEFKDIIREEIKSAIEEFKISSKFRKASENYQGSMLDRQELEKKQKEIVKKFIAADAKEKQKLKPELIKMHKELQKLESQVSKYKRDFEAAIKGEPIEYVETD